MTIVRKMLLCFFLALTVSAFAAQPKPGLSEERELSVDGRDRSYRIYRPVALDTQKPAPLVIVMHGGFGSAAQAESAYGWNGEADRHKFIVVYPDGVRHSWNAGGACCGAGARQNIDDVGFISAVIADVMKANVIDPKHVYLTGMSNGAAMSYRYACEGTYPIAAIGPVAGSLSEDCPHPHAVSVMEIHGMDDQNIPMAGGYGPKAYAKVDWMPVEKVIDQFRIAANCGAPVASRNGPVETQQSACAGGREVTLITIDGAGHQWPGGKMRGFMAGKLLGIDPPSQDLDATDTVWQFGAGVAKG